MVLSHASQSIAGAALQRAANSLIFGNWKTRVSGLSGVSGTARFVFVSTVNSFENRVENSK
jgi:hypothetical protein